MPRQSVQYLDKCHPWRHVYRQVVKPDGFFIDWKRIAM